MYLTKFRRKSVGFVFLVFLWTLCSFLVNQFHFRLGLPFSILTVLIFCFLSEEWKFIFILFALPFAAMYKVSLYSSSTIIFLYLIYIIMSILKKKVLSLIDLVLLLVICLFQMLAVLTFNAQISSLVSFMLNIIFAKVAISNFLQMENKASMYYFCAVAFSISVSLNILLTAVFPNLPYIIKPSTVVGLIPYSRFTALVGDPNYLSQLIILAVSLLLGVITNTEQRHNKVIFSLLCLYLTISGLRTFSKSYYLMLSILIVLLYLNVMRKLKDNGRARFISTSIVTTFFLVGTVIFFGEIVFPLFEQRATGGVSFLTGRDVIWNGYFRMLKDNPLIMLIGTGFGNGRYLARPFIGSLEAAHNLYIEMLTEIGLISVLALLYLWRESLRYVIRIIRSPKVLFFGMYLVSSLALSLSSYDTLYVFIPILALCDSSDMED